MCRLSPFYDPVREYGSVDKVSGIDLQRIGNIEEHIQREAVSHVRRFNRADE